MAETLKLPSSTRFSRGADREEYRVAARCCGHELGKDETSWPR